MSDDEDLIYTKKARTIHYGSLEDAERTKLIAASMKSDDSDDEDYNKKSSSDAMGQIHISNEYFDLENEMLVLFIFHCFHIFLNLIC